MDIRQKLKEVQNVLPKEQEEERRLINSLLILMFGRDSEELPKEFNIICMLDNESISNFLKQTLGLHVKKVSLIPFSVLMGKPKFHVELY